MSLSLPGTPCCSWTYNNGTKYFTILQKFHRLFQIKVKELPSISIISRTGMIICIDDRSRIDWAKVNRNRAAQCRHSLW